MPHKTKVPTFTAQRLREQLDYNPDTGQLSWRVTRRGVIEGMPAGAKTGKGALSVQLDGQFYLAHRLVWMWVHGEWPQGVVDHVNCNPADNRLVNLRLSTVAENTANQRLSARSSSGFKGVTWNRKCNKWQAQIKKDGKCHYLGVFTEPSEAHAAYVEKARELFGEFARAA